MSGLFEYAQGSINHITSKGSENGVDYTWLQFDTQSFQSEYSANSEHLLGTPYVLYNSLARVVCGGLSTAIYLLNKAPGFTRPASSYFLVVSAVWYQYEHTVQLAFESRRYKDLSICY